MFPMLRPRGLYLFHLSFGEYKTMFELLLSVGSWFKSNALFENVTDDAKINDNMRSDHDEQILYCSLMKSETSAFSLSFSNSNHACISTLSSDLD